MSISGSDAPCRKLNADAACSSMYSINDALDTPPTAVPLAEDAIGHPIGERHLPLVAIPPTSALPPCPRGSPRAGTRLDSSSVHAAAIDRHPRRLAGLDMHAGGNGSAKPAKRDH